jgi:hypothetical protein
MNKGEVGEHRGSKETDGCPLTEEDSLGVEERKGEGDQCRGE